MKQIILTIIFSLLLFSGCSNTNQLDDTNNNRTIFEDDNGNKVNITSEGNITIVDWDRPIGQYIITNNDTRFEFQKEYCEVIVDTNTSLGIVCNK